MAMVESRGDGQFGTETGSSFTKAMETASHERKTPGRKGYETGTG